ncbi:MAG: type III-B CRISPR module-associated protein Cmr5 [Anaerolineaceae bacterium]|jgi:CRISPR type III-B/RAMP module-associated protein Cmr5
MNNLNQQLARSVYDKISDVNAAGKNDDYKRKYGKMALKLPALVQNAGLLQTFAFIEDNKEDPSQELLRDLAHVLGFENKAALMTACIDLPFAGYRYLTRRCVIALTWFKRFVQSTWPEILAAEDDND